ncbi:hypothetical protein GGR21_002868 [Dysgonomonas hofstadii]|uniref:Uncharacterized protein n=1 Tax=Dysgonomonas hofstadii TaxID=637886 RepID=A0A840CTF1_9BACT|nr:hypothetical protein [Dysgonomonas hofstadii]MBB4036954.1 hypothetical protein [Dysgonomonas hofstadii]
MLRKIGSFMATIGLLAIVLNFLDMVPKLLAWIYLWGDAVAWVIMIAITVIGAVLWLLGRNAATE